MMRWKSDTLYDVAWEIYKKQDEYMVNGKIDVTLIQMDFNLTKNEAIYIKKKIEYKIKRLHKIDNWYHNLSNKDKDLYMKGDLDPDKYPEGCGVLDYPERHNFY